MQLMNQNFKAMNRKQQLFRLYDGYSALLKNAQQHMAFIVAHADTLTPEKYQLLLKNADDDIAFAKAKLDSMIPAIPNQTMANPVQVMALEACHQGQGSRIPPEQAASTLQESQAKNAPKMMSEEQREPSQTPVPSERQSGVTQEDEHSGSFGWAIAGIAGIVGFSVGVPLFIKWINKDPQRNIARVRDFLNAFKNA